MKEPVGDRRNCFRFPRRPRRGAGCGHSRPGRGRAAAGRCGAPAAVRRSTGECLGRGHRGRDARIPLRIAAALVAWSVLGWWWPG